MSDISKRAADLHLLIHGKTGLCCNLEETLAYNLSQAYEQGRADQREQDAKLVEDAYHGARSEGIGRALANTIRNQDCGFLYAVGPTSPGYTNQESAK